MDEVLRLDIDRALVILRGKNVLEVDKYDYSNHPEAKKLKASKASAHIPAWNTALGKNAEKKGKAEAASKVTLAQKLQQQADGEKPTPYQEQANPDPEIIEVAESEVLPVSKEPSPESTIEKNEW